MKKLIILLSLITITNNKETKYCDIKGNINNPGVYEIKDNYTIQNIINDAGGLKNNSYTNNINLSKKVTDEMVIYINTKEEIEKLKYLNNCDCSPQYVYLECEESNILKEEYDESNNFINESQKSDYIDKEIETTTTKQPNNYTRTTTTKSNIIKNTTTKNTTSKTTVKTTTPKEITTTTTAKIAKSIININNCTKEDLITLKGLGEKKASKIIEYRETIGAFKTIEEIMNVSGIGESTFNAIKDFIEV